MNEVLPLIPHGATIISNLLSVVNKDDTWTYFHGGLPVFSHEANNKNTFRFITSSFISQGICRNVDIKNTFKVTKSSVIRNCNKFKNEGADGFFNKKKKSGKGTVLTPPKIEEAEELLEQGFMTSEVAKKIDVKYETLSKAILQGRVKKNYKNKQRNNKI